MARSSNTDRRPLMAGNWKMNLNHLEAIALVQKLAFSLQSKELEEVEVAVLPPFTDIRSVQTLINGDKLGLVYGAQDLSVHDAGAYTGEVSGAMLSKLGCTYVLVGHSERRQYHGETDEVVGTKLTAAIKHGLVPILCVGEGLEVRQEGRAVQHTVDQVSLALEGVKADKAASVVVAYEPVWAIGTGEVATPADAQEVCSAIRSRLAELYDKELANGVRVLYGGSMKSSNVAGIMAQKDVDGGLVGGASLDADEFARLVRFSEQPLPDDA